MSGEDPEYRTHEHTGVEWRHGIFPTALYVPFRALQRTDDFVQFSKMRLPIILEEETRPIGILFSPRHIAAANMEHANAIQLTDLALTEVEVIRAILAEQQLIRVERMKERAPTPLFVMLGMSEKNEQDFSRTFGRVIVEAEKAAESRELEEISPGVYVPEGGPTWGITPGEWHNAQELNRVDDIIEELEKEFGSPE